MFKNIRFKSLRQIVLLLLISVLIVACGGKSAAPTITGAQWQWHEMNESEAETVVPNPEDYTINFAEDGSISIKADCNLASGTYTLDGDALTITLGPSTLAYCGDESLDQSFIGNLSMVDRYSIKDDVLILTLTGGAGEMTFKAE